MDTLDILEAIATVGGLTGAMLVATQSRYSQLGWIACLVANVACIGLAWGLDRHGLLLQQIGFATASIVGVVRGRMLQRDQALPDRTVGRRAALAATLVTRRP